MKSITKWNIGIFLATIISAFFAGWLFWVPLRLFLFSLIPQSASFAWVGKLFIMVLIGWFGGIGVPIVIMILGFYFFVEMNK